jgi:hypothetical protein
VPSVPLRKYGMIRAPDLMPQVSHLYADRREGKECV